MVNQNIAAQQQTNPPGASQTNLNWDDRDCSSAVLGSPYIPVDSWIYPAVMRLYSLGYIDGAFLNMRPWTRSNLRKYLDQAADHLEDANGLSGSGEAQALYDALKRETYQENASGCQTQNGTARVESAYTIVRGISGTPLRDSFHLGSTIVNDYGRPYTNGLNNYTGASGYVSARRFVLYARGEFQASPSASGYSSALGNQLATIDLTNYYYNQTCVATGTLCTPIPYNGQPTIPAGPISSTFRGSLLEAYVSAQYFNHIFSFGKQDDWQSPAMGASMSYSNNAENIYSFRINRIEPLWIPGLSKLTGPFRYEFLVGPLKGHAYPIDPWAHVEKVSFRPTDNLEFGFERTVIWGGKDHSPITLHTFGKSFFSFSAPEPDVKNSPADPGARFGAFDFSYRLPFLRDWVTLYADSEVHDDVSPIDAPRRASWRPGIYLSHFPSLSKLDLRAEAAYTDPPITNSYGGRFMYWEVIQRSGYTNQGQMFGDWVGREGKGGQAWLTYHLSGNEWMQLSFRNHKVAKDFIPSGTTLNNFNFQVVKRLRKDFEIEGNFAVEKWKAPIYLSGEQTVTNTDVQITWYPNLFKIF
jgi:hypothetical protein